MKLSERFRNSLESQVEKKLLDRGEGIAAIQNLIDGLNSTNFKFNSSSLDFMLPFTELNLNQISDQIKNILAERFSVAGCKRYNPDANSPHWTENPYYQVSQLLQFLLDKLKVGRRSGDFEQIKRSLGPFAKKNGINPELIRAVPVQKAMMAIYEVLFLENLKQEKSSAIVELLFIPDIFSEKVARVLE